MGVAVAGALVVPPAGALLVRPAGGAVAGPHHRPAARTGCHRPAPTTANGYADLFAGLDPREWGGGDVALTVPLFGRSVWLFGDTFSSGRLVHSSAVVQRGGCLHVSHGGAQLLPDDHVTVRPTSADPSLVYWIEDARAAGADTLLITARAIDLFGTAPWDFRDAGYARTAVVEVDERGDATFRGWVARTVAPAPDPGPILDCEAPAPPVPHHLCYGERRHPELRLAGGRTLVTVGQNWDDGVLRPPSAYRPLFRSG